MTMGDEVAVLDDGALRQIGDPEAVYRDPADRFVAAFLGNPSMNQFETTVRADGRDLAFEFEDTTLARRPADAVPLSEGDDATLGLRPENIRLTAADVANPDAADRGGFVAEVGVTEYQGNDNFVHLRLGDANLTAVVPPSVSPDPGDRVAVSVAPEDAYVFDAETGTALATAGGGPESKRADERNA
jgi:multiple sugar transport system ATP-binding protein